MPAPRRSPSAPPSKSPLLRLVMRSIPERGSRRDAYCLSMLQQKRGAIVITASVAGLVATPGTAAYAASKHAVIGLTKAAAGEVARQGIRYNAVCPGAVDTRMIHSLEAQINPADPASVARRYQSAIPLGRYVTPDEIANTVLFLCLRPRLGDHRRAIRRRRRPHRHRRRRHPGDAELTIALRIGAGLPCVGWIVTHISAICDRRNCCIDMSSNSAAIPLPASVLNRRQAAD